MSMEFQKYLIAGCFVTLLMMTTGADAGTKYSVGGQGGFATLTSGDVFRFKPGSSYGATLGHRLSDRWHIGLSASWFQLDLKDNAEMPDTLFPGDWGNAFPDTTLLENVRVSATRLNMMFSRYWLNPRGLLNIETGLGGGLLIWKIADSETDEPVRVSGEKVGATDFLASEVVLSGMVGLVIQPTENVSFGLKGYGDYLTGAGTSFLPVVDNLRNRFLLGAAVTFSLHFGASEKPTTWRSDESWAAQPATRPAAWLSRADADGDGVTDSDDRCFNTPKGVIVDRHGCPVDTDSDGVPDGLDDCPGTPAQAVGQVDIFGCPVDSDFDGIPDYLDACPHNPVGAEVDDNGCAIDDDNDGVPNGLDDCPYTLVGVDVDKYGCIDLSTFAKPMILHIDYAPGSFEVDPNNLERLKRLAGVLRFVTDMKLEINGYTDNIGTTQANADLSLKRARRVRDYLVSFGIDSNRLSANGLGETNFIDSNQTAEGRARNRRIEIVFYK